MRLKHFTDQLSDLNEIHAEWELIIEKMVELRAIRSSDLNILFEWRNNKHIISLSASQKAVSLVEHSKWFKHTIASSKTKIFIILNDQKPIRQIRFDKIQDQKTGCEVSIYLIPGQENKGMGSQALNHGINKILQLWNIDKIEAWVQKITIKVNYFLRKINL